MPAFTVEFTTESERLMFEAAIAYVTTLQTAAIAAPHGSILDVCEKVALGQGKAFLRETLRHALHGRIAELDKKGGRRGFVRDVAGPVGTKGRTFAP